MSRRQNPHCESMCPIEGLRDLKCDLIKGHGGEHGAMDERVVDNPYGIITWTTQCAVEIERLRAIIETLTK